MLVAVPALSLSAQAASAPAAANAVKLPIVEKPLTLTAIINYSTLRPNQDTTEVWDWFAKKTNVTIKPQIVKDADKLATIFASRDFPDIYMNAAASVTQLAGAAEDGDIIPLDDLMAKFAPTWNNFFKENPLVANNCKLGDGKVYFLPNIAFSAPDRDLRDQWIITDSWLKELKLDMPKTTDDFLKVMKAFKDNAGKGSIPKNVLPFYYFFDNYVGGQFDVYASFGVTVTHQDYLAVEKDKVVFQAINPDLKAPLKWLRELYAAGVTPPECFTDDNNTYLQKTSANPPIVGSYGSYANRNPALQSPMAPLKSPTNAKPTMRRQAYVPNPARAMAIFKKNPNPEATIKFAEFIASDLEAKMTAARGLKDTVWKQNSDGRVTEIFWEESPDLMNKNAAKLGTHNSFIGLLDKNFFEKNYFDATVEQKNSRSWAFANVYKDFLGPEGSVYVAASLSSDEENSMKVINTELTNIRKKTFSDWITGKGDIDKDWDAYVASMKKLDLDKYLSLKQKAYDAMIKK